MRAGWWCHGCGAEEAVRWWVLPAVPDRDGHTWPSVYRFCGRCGPDPGSALAEDGLGPLSRDEMDAWEVLRS